MFEAAFSTGNELDITELLSKLNITVTTDDIEVAIPGIVAKYGSGKAVSILGKFIEKQSEFHIKADSGIALDLSLLVDLKVGDEVAIHASLPHNMGAVLLQAKDKLLTGNISAAKLGACGADSTSTFSTCADIIKGLQTTIDGYVQIANAALKTGVEIPTIFGLDLSDFAIVNFDGYLYAGITIHQTMWEKLANMLGVIRDEIKLERLEEGLVMQRFQQTQQMFLQ
jgi:hypothetical protein